MGIKRIQAARTQGIRNLLQWGITTTHPHIWDTHILISVNTKASIRSPISMPTLLTALILLALPLRTRGPVMSAEHQILASLQTSVPSVGTGSLRNRVYKLRDPPRNNKRVNDSGNILTTGTPSTNVPISFHFLRNLVFVTLSSLCWPLYCNLCAFLFPDVPLPCLLLIRLFSTAL